MNLAGFLPPQFQALLGPIFKITGIDVKAWAFTEAQFQQRLAAASAPAIARLKKDGLTPANKGDDPAAEKALIRSAMFNLAAETLRGLHIPEVVIHNGGADALRDAYAKKVIPLAAPRFDHTSTVEQMVAAITAAWLEVLT